MRVVSVNVGLPREVEWEGRRFPTSIFKEPVAGPVRLGPLNLEGDRQANLKFHGGPHQVVYIYPSEHYSYWRSVLPPMEMPWGTFGENLTTEGLNEHSVHIGDIFRVGTAELRITLPRMPCYKLAMRFQRTEMVEQFLQSQRLGFYCGVEREGTIQASDVVRLAQTDQHGLRVIDVVRLKTTELENRDLLEKAATTPALPQSWREQFRKKLETI